MSKALPKKSKDELDRRSNKQESYKSRQFRDRLTRASWSRPVDGEETQAMQWNRWTP